MKVLSLLLAILFVSCLVSAQTDGFLEKSYTQSWGNSSFGTSVDVFAKIYGSAANRQLKSHTIANGVVLSQNFQLMAFETNVVNNGTAPTALTTYKIMGYTVLALNDTVLTYNNSWNKEYRITKNLMVGPVEVAVTGIVGGNFACADQLDLTTTNTDIQNQSTPSITTYGKCEVATSVQYATASTSGSLVYLNLKVETYAIGVYDKDLNAISLILYMNLDLKTLAGTVVVNATLAKPDVDPENYSLTLYSGAGFTKNEVLIDENKVVEFGTR